MIRRLLLIATLGVMLSGCFMAPLALIGPVASGWSTASLIQSGVSTGANYMVKKSTGKTIAEHAMESITKDIFKQSYFPTNKQIYLPENEFSAKCKKYDYYCKRILNNNPAAHSTLIKNEVSFGCKKHDYYCKRLSRKQWRQYINQNKSLLGSS